MRHEDPGDFEWPENEEWVLQNRDQGRHEGRADGGFEVLKESEGRGEFHEGV